MRVSQKPVNDPWYDVVVDTGTEGVAATARG